MFNKREENEIKKLVVNLTANIIYEMDFMNERIHLFHPEFHSVEADLKKGKGGDYKLSYYHTTTNKEVVITPQNFDGVKYHLGKWLRMLETDFPTDTQKKEKVNQLSKRFYNVFNEATVINNLDFKESSGMVFRKSLEILIKDFLLFLLPNFEEQIRNKTIGGIIRYFYEVRENQLKIKTKEEFLFINVELNEIKSLCKKIDSTFRLGNDFSHYERRMENLSSNDLRVYILQITEYINYQLEELSIREKRFKLSNEFDSENLNS